MSATRAPRPPRRLDASMDLLNNIVRNPIDPDYATVAARADRPPRRRLQVVAVTVVGGLMLGLAAANTVRAAPTAAAERVELIVRIEAEQTRQADLRRRASDLTKEVGTAERTGAGLDRATADRLERLGAAAGGLPVTGPGLVVTLDDGPDRGVQGSEVIDTDVRVAVNGLWQAGAEAVAVNGHRLSARTAIRGAGEAITVDYRSLTRPYVIEAIGDGPRMEGRLARSPAGQWWASLRDKYGMRYEVARSANLSLQADPGLRTDRATAPTR